MKYLCYTVLFVLSALIVSKAQVTDANGKKQGYWKKKDERNHLVYEGTFKDDKPVGRFKYYHPNDTVRAIMDFSKDGKSAYARLFHMNGKRMAEGRYVQKELKDSVWTYYDELGTLLSRETYKNGKKNGPSYVYLPDGDVSEERNFVNDVQDGAFIEYFNAKQLKSKANYVNGQIEGRVCYYYPNGIEVAAGFYKNGKKNGPWIYKTKTGKISEKELYKNGELASPKETEAFFLKNKVEETPAAPTPSGTGKPAPKPTKKKG